MLNDIFRIYFNILYRIFLLVTTKEQWKTITLKKFYIFPSTFATSYILLFSWCNYRSLYCQSVECMRSLCTCSSLLFLWLGSLKGFHSVYKYIVTFSMRRTLPYTQQIGCKCSNDFQFFKWTFFPCIDCHNFLSHIAHCTIAFVWRTKLSTA